MILLDYIEATHFHSQKQFVQAQLLLYYLYKENEILEYSTKEVRTIFSDAGQTQKLNSSRIIKELVKALIIKKLK